MDNDFFQKTVHILRAGDQEAKREAFTDLRRFRPIVFSAGMILTSIILLLFAIALPPTIHDKYLCLLFSLVCLVVGVWNTGRILKCGITDTGKIGRPRKFHIE